MVYQIRKDRRLKWKHINEKSATGAAVTATTVESSNSTDGKNGLFPVETSCSLFEVYENGVGNTLSCLEGEHFDVILRECVNIRKSNCFEKDEVQCTEIGFIPHEGNCSEYYECAFGADKISYSGSCDLGLYFDPIKKICNSEVECYQTNEVTCTTDKFLPDEHNCTSYYQCDYGENKISYRKTCQPGDQFDPIAKECRPVNQVNCHEVGSNFNCPEEQGYFVDSSDCSKYYECVGGNSAVTYHRSCGSSLHFDPRSQKCDNEDIVGCQGSPCTANISDTDDCYKYFACVQGMQYHWTCPNGQHFHENNLTCTWIHLAECVTYEFECEDGYFQHNSGCYKLVMENATYQEAEEKCAAENAVLAVVKDRDTQHFLQGLAGEAAEDTTLPMFAWIGLNFVNWQWWKYADSSNLRSSFFNSWEGGSPDNALTSTLDVCSSMNKITNGNVYYKWNVSVCEELKSYICQRTELSCPQGYVLYGHKCVKVFENERKTFVESQVECAEEGGRLAAVTDVPYLNTLIALAKKGNEQRYWVGISRTLETNQWILSDESTLSDFVSADLSPRDETCVTVYMESEWEGFPCNLTLPALCVYPPSPWCFDDYKPYNGICYKAFDNVAQMNYTEAEQTCINDQGTVLNISDKIYVEFFKLSLFRSDDASGWWIKKSNSVCSSLEIDGLQQNVNCETSKRVICQRYYGVGGPAVSDSVCTDGFQLFDSKGTCIKLFAQKEKWNKATEVCQHNGATLLNIGNEEEEDNLFSLNLDDDKVWLGEVYSVKADKCVVQTTEKQFSQTYCHYRHSFICEKKAKQCNNGYRLFDGYCYKLHSNESTNSEASSICQSENTELVLVGDPDVQSFLFGIIQQTSLNLWVNMAGSEPSCVVLKKDQNSIQFITENCQNQYAFVCQHKAHYIVYTMRGSGLYDLYRSLERVSGSTNYSMAEVKCADRGGRLADITDGRTHNYAAEKLAVTSRHWMGLSSRWYDGTWYFSDGQKLGSFFKGVRRNISESEELCMVFFHQKHLSGHDCNQKIPFICEVESSGLRLQEKNIFFKNQWIELIDYDSSASNTASVFKDDTPQDTKDFLRQWSLAAGYGSISKNSQDILLITDGQTDHAFQIIPRSCPQGYINYGRTCYKYVDVPQKFFMALLYCARESSYLALIKDKFGIETLQILLPSGTNAWVGGYHYGGQWRGSDGEIIPVFSEWDKDKNKNPVSNDKCVYLSSNDSTLLRSDCDVEYTFVCENPGNLECDGDSIFIDGKCYLVNADLVTEQEAYQLCKDQVYKDLAVPHGSIPQLILSMHVQFHSNDSVKESPSFWLGLKYKMNIKDWYNYPIIGRHQNRYTNWYSSEPNLERKVLGGIGVALMSPTYNWFQVAHGEEIFYFCQYQVCYNQTTDRLNETCIIPITFPGLPVTNMSCVMEEGDTDSWCSTGVDFDWNHKDSNSRYICPSTCPVLMIRLTFLGLL
ncbi:macrophage mannose receptor 1-like [Limulus polyphemus]|uniref:Macrophage mannose receptor 1-like n=1 Tax=Limulus polyphemus TaxID=6850 RepID=A0ABM1SJB8_LIMPO|nr:macrophage mannose receptor 1-like [Limulus polyphemus]